MCVLRESTNNIKYCHYPLLPPRAGNQDLIVKNIIYFEKGLGRIELEKAWMLLLKTGSYPF